MTNDDLDLDLDLTPEAPSNLVGPRSIIDVRGLGPEVLRLSRLRLHHYEIANQLNGIYPELGLSHDAVTRWIKHFDTLTPAEKSKIESTSVYDLMQRTQDISVRVEAALHRVVDKQVKLSARKLTRKLLQFVAKTTEDLEQMKRDEQVRKGMLDVLDRVRPGARAQIERELLDGDYLGTPAPVVRAKDATIDASTGEVVPTQAPGPKSAIDRLGLGKDILRMVRSGRTQQEVADALDLSREQVNRWLSKYQKMSPSEQLMVEERSIYNVVDRLEENFQGLIDDLDDTQGEDALELNILTEMLENLKFVQATVSRIERIRSDERFGEIFLKVLNDFPQGERAAAITALNSYRRDQANVRISG